MSSDVSLQHCCTLSIAQDPHLGPHSSALLKALNPVLGKEPHPTPAPHGKPPTQAVQSMLKRAGKQSEQTRNHNPAIPTTPHPACCLEGFVRREEGKKGVGARREGRGGWREGCYWPRQCRVNEPERPPSPTWQAVGVTVTPPRPLPTASYGSTFCKCSQIWTEPTQGTKRALGVGCCSKERKPRPRKKDDFLKHCATT